MTSNRKKGQENMKWRFEPFKCFAVLLAVTCLLTACQASPAADARPEMPTAELNEAVLSDYELIFGEEPGKSGAAKTDSRPDENGHYPEGIYLKLDDVSWPDLLTRSWTDTGSRKQFKGRAFPVTLTVETQPEGDWIQRIEVDYAFPGTARFRELPSFQAAPELFQSECKAVSSALLDLKEQIGTAEFDHFGLSPESMEGIRCGQLLCGRQQQVRNMVTRFEFEKDCSRMTWTFDAVPFKTLPIRRASAGQILSDDLGQQSPEIGLCLSNGGHTANEFEILRGVRSACAAHGLHYAVQGSLSDRSDWLAAIRSLREQGCKAIVADVIPFLEQDDEFRQTLGNMVLIVMEQHPKLAPDGRKQAVISLDWQRAHVPVVESMVRRHKTLQSDQALNILFAAMPPEYNDEARINRVMDGLRQRGLNAAKTVVNVSNGQLARAALQDYLSGGGTFDTYLDINDADLAPLMKTMGLNPSGHEFYSYNFTPAVIPQLQSNELTGFVYADYIRSGRQAVETALRMVDGEPVDPVQIVPHVLVTPQTVGDFLNRPSSNAAAELMQENGKTGHDRTLAPDGTANMATAETEMTETVPEAGNVVDLYLAYNGWLEKTVDLTAFNRLLNKKGYPYRLHLINRRVDVQSGFWNRVYPPAEGREGAFNRNLRGDYTEGAEWHCGEDWQRVIEESRNGGDPVDLFLITNRATAFELPLSDFVQKGIAADLTPWLAGESGQRLQAAWPEPLWQAISQQQACYALPGGLPDRSPQTAVCWVNRRLAEKYGIDIQDWSSDIWTHRDDLIKVWNGEHQNERFAILPGDPFLALLYPSLTPIYGRPSFNALPVIYNEAERRYQCIYDNETYIKTAEFVQSLVDDGYLNYMQISSPDTFLVCYEPPADHADDYVAVGEGQCRLANPFETLVCMTAWSEHQTEAFDLVTAIDTDPELNRELDRILSGQTKVISFKNPFIGETDSGYQVYGDASLYSPVCGQLPDITPCRQVVTDCVEVMMDILMRPTNDSAVRPRFDLTEDRALLREAGIDRVVEAFNAQLAPGETPPSWP